MYSLLIVDDEPMILKGMREKIDWPSYGFSKIVVESEYKSALEAAILLQPSLCLLDVCLGPQKGYDLIEEIKAVGVTSHYVMMSGHGEFKYAQKAMHCGALGYLLKPVEASALREVVERVTVDYLGGAVKRDTADTDPVLQRPYDEYLPLVKKMLLIVRAEYDTPLTLKVLGEMFRMNSAYLGQVFLSETKMKLSDYLMAYRLIKAKELLTHTDDKIATIAKNVGYDNMSYFYSLFKQYFEQSPTDFRDA
ncbi:MAG: response regulator [Clostridia bacterium]|nr:response regulator [Clostridia bacterium]